MRGLAGSRQVSTIRQTHSRKRPETAMLSIRQIHPVFVGEVSGVDLTKPLTREEAAAIDAGMDRYAVLVFHGQNITDDQQMEFTVNFGEIENAKGGNITKDHEYRLKKGDRK